QASGLHRDADLLAAAEEVLGADAELAEETVELAPAAAELQLGAVRLLPLEEQVDLLLLGVGVDVDRVLLAELEVAELVDLGDAVADRRHVDQAPLVDPQLAAQHLVLGALVALELDAADLELVPLGDVDHQVGDPVGALDQLGLDTG